MNLKQVWAKVMEEGLPLPQAQDPAEGKQSFRLLTAYVSFLIASSSVLALHIWPSLLVPCGMAITFFGLNMIFYMLKKLTSAKIDLNDQELSLNNEESKEKS